MKPLISTVDGPNCNLKIIAHLNDGANVKTIPWDDNMFNKLIVSRDDMITLSSTNVNKLVKHQKKSDVQSNENTISILLRKKGLKSEIS